MKARSRRYLSPVAMVLLLLAGIITPVVVVGAATTTAPTQSQLLSLVGAAQTSKAYAYSAVDYAASHGLAVSSARSQLNQGDSFLAAAQADANSGSNITGGIESVQAAMRDYTFAATSASVALSKAGLTTSVEYAAAEGAIAEVNATASIVATVVAQGCAQAGVGTSSSSALAQACSQVNAQIASATAHLNQAASLLLQSNGQTTASLDISQVLSLVTTARAEVDATQPNLVNIAAYTYSQRGQSYANTFIQPLISKANATIASEQSFQSALTQFKTAFGTYAQSQASAVSTTNSSASALAASVSQVNTSAVSSDASTAQSTAAQVTLEMNALLVIQGIVSLPSVVSDINSSLSAASNYRAALASAETQSSAYSGTSLSGFSVYLGAMSTDATTVQSAGSTYLSAYQKVVTDLSILLAIPGVQPIYTNLTGLQVSGNVNSLDASLQQEISAMGTVKTDTMALSSAVSTSESSIIVSSSLVSTATLVSTDGAAYLNSTGASALDEVATSVQATQQAAKSFVTSANASTQATIGAYPTSVSALNSAGASLENRTHASAGSIDKAAAYLGSDVQSRTSEVASGQVEVSHALQLFSNLNVSGGTEAMAQASLDFETASSVNAAV